MSDEKYVGSIAAAKIVALIKAETAKKYDKTGGKINGSAEITGDVHAGGAVQSDLLLSAPSVTVHNGAGASVHINCSGDNAAEISSLGSDGKSHYSRFAVGTPAGDNDATTKAYVDDHAAKYEVITVTSTEVSDLGYDAEEGATKYSVTFDASFDSILANLAANKSMKFNITIPDDTGGFPLSFTTGYFSALNNGMFAFTGSIAGAPIVLSIGGLGSATVYLYADYLPAPNPDGSDDGKSLAVDGDKWAIKKAAIDDVLSDTSTNPVQNKAVKAALDSKLSTQGGEILGHLSVGLTVSAEGSVSTGRTSTDTGIHFEKAGSDVGRISHGSDPMTGVAPIARLKVASPTEDDDAATKAYVDNNAAGGGAVRYDAAQTLDGAQQGQARTNIGAIGHDSPQFAGYLSLAPANAPLGTGVGLSPIGSGNNFTLDISDVNENTPTRLTGVKTPTDADTNAAATVEYVKNKVSEVAASGGVDVDNALSATSTNPVQNKVITSALTGKADKTALNSKADKTALDAKADKTALDAKLDKTGGTLTGNLTGKYITGTWLQSTAASNLGRTPGKIAVLDDSGWVYYRTPSELFADLGIANAIKSYVDAAIIAAINSAY